MSSRTRDVLAILAVAMLPNVIPRTAAGQGMGLGGYGATSPYANPTMAGSRSMIAPYGGMFEGFTPSRSGGGSALAYRPRPTASPVAPPRGMFRLAPGAGGMGATPSLMTGPTSAGPGGLLRPRPMVPGGSSVMPPSFGYPFRQPPMPGSSTAIFMPM